MHLLALYSLNIFCFLSLSLSFCLFYNIFQFQFQYRWLISAAVAAVLSEIRDFSFLSHHTRYSPSRVTSCTPTTNAVVSRGQAVEYTWKSTRYTIDTLHSVRAHSFSIFRYRTKCLFFVLFHLRFTSLHFEMNDLFAKLHSAAADWCEPKRQRQNMHKPLSRCVYFPVAHVHRAYRANVCNERLNRRMLQLVFVFMFLFVSRCNIWRNEKMEINKIVQIHCAEHLIDFGCFCFSFPSWEVLNCLDRVPSCHSPLSINRLSFWIWCWLDTERWWMCLSVTERIEWCMAAQLLWYVDAMAQNMAY